MIIDKVDMVSAKRLPADKCIRVVRNILSHDSLTEDMVLRNNIDDTLRDTRITMENLLKASCRCIYTSIYMKKNRLLIMLSYYAKSRMKKKMTDIILRETSTIGVRRSVVKRHVMEREVINVNTDMGDVRVKVSTWGDIKKVTPEYEDCRNIAMKTGMPLISVYEQVNRHMDIKTQDAKNSYKGN